MCQDASRNADEVIEHLAGLVGAKVTVTLEAEVHEPRIREGITEALNYILNSNVMDWHVAIRNTG
jgi:hypothetical protein